MIGSVALFVFTMFNLKKNPVYLQHKTRSNIIVYSLGSFYFILALLFAVYVGKG
jgi:hypothetical protein